MGIIIFGHRGFSSQYPENTLLAFKKAMDAGADGIELDIRASKDKKAVVIHDEDFSRVANNPAKVHDMDYSGIRKIVLPQEEHVPMLEEVFSFFPNDGYMNLEIKEQEALKPLIDLLRSYKPLFRIVFSSFHHDLLTELREAIPGIPIGLLIGNSFKTILEGTFRGNSTEVIDAYLSRYKPYSLHLPLQLFNFSPIRETTNLLRKIKESGIHLYWWTIDDLPITEFLRDRDIIDGVITNQVERMVGIYH
jgi:glycerophosphoryl diester phosphodiesterase